MSSVSAFLLEFVDPALQDQARDAMSALFTQLHLALARDFFDTYASSVPRDETALPPTPAKPSKKTETATTFALPCSATTAKGAACPRRCCADAPDTFCAAHLAQSLKPAKEPKKEAAEPKPVSKKAARAAAEPCSGKTAKGGSCSRKCCAESDAFCAAHLAQSLKPSKKAKAAADAPKKAKAAASKKAKAAKPVPTHNHALTEEAEANCDLCQSHGNAADPNLTEQQFEEMSGDLQSRLKSIMSNIHEVETAAEDAEDDAEFGAAALYSSEEEEDEEDEDILAGFDATGSDSGEEDEEEDN